MQPLIFLGDLNILEPGRHPHYPFFAPFEYDFYLSADRNPHGPRAARTQGVRPCCLIYGGNLVLVTAQERSYAGVKAALTSVS